jgi:uncharacterized protein YbdZ (MbtH family)
VSVKTFDENNDNSLVCSAMWRNAVPPTGEVVYGEADHAGRLDHIEQNWTDIRPRSQRNRLAERRCSDM